MPFKPHRTEYGTYRIRGTHHGVSISKSAGTRSFAEAQAIAEAWERKVFEEKVLGYKPPETFAELAIGYIEAGGDLGRRAEDLIQHLGERTADQINNAVLKKVAVDVYPDAKNSTINRNIIAPVSALMNWAAEQDRAPLRKWKRLPERQTKTNWRRPSEIERIFAQFREPTTVAYAAAHVGCGLRASEAAFLHAIDVAPDLTWLKVLGDARVDEGTLKKGYQGTKGKRDRTVEIPPRARELMTGHVRTGTKGRAFLNYKGQPWSGRDAISTSLRKACERADLPPMSPHDLRHTFATWHNAVYGDPLLLMRVGGWTALRLVERYAHVADRSLRQEVIDSGWLPDPNSSAVSSTSGGPKLVVKNG